MCSWSRAGDHRVDRRPVRVHTSHEREKGNGTLLFRVIVPVVVCGSVAFLAAGCEQWSSFAPDQTWRRPRVVSMHQELMAPPLLVVPQSVQVLGTKVRSQNKVYKVDPSTDLEMCKAIVRTPPPTTMVDAWVLLVPRGILSRVY